VDHSDCALPAAPALGTALTAPCGLLSAGWRLAAEHGGPACLLTPGNGVLTVAWANRGLCELLALDAGSLIGRSLGELAADTPWVSLARDPADPDADDGPAPGWATAAHRLARDCGGTMIARLGRQDGSWVRARVRVVPMSAPPALMPGAASLREPGVVDRLGSPPPPRTWLVVLDEVVEGMRDLQAALAVAEHRFTALAGCAPVGIFASDAGLRLGYVNGLFVALTGLPAHDLLGTGWLDVIHRDDLASVYEAVQTVLGGSTVALTVRLARADHDPPCWLLLRLAPTTTPTRAVGFIGTAEDVTERRSWEQHLTYQARHDPLTGLVNRRRLIEVLTDLLSGRRARDHEFALLFLDLDGFKEINDRFGHEAGDRALVEVADRLQAVARDTDLVARVAGDEFVIVLRGVTTSVDAAAAARRHLAALAAPVRLGVADFPLTASVGAALPAPGDAPDTLLRTADQAMYEAKSAGPGQYRVVPPEEVR